MLHSLNLDNIKVMLSAILDHLTVVSTGLARAAEYDAQELPALKDV